MNKPKINYWLDILLLIAIIVTAFTAIVIFFFLPSGVRQGGYQEFWGVAKFTWSAWHKWFGLSFIILALVHYILHLDWVAAMTKNLLKKKGSDDIKRVE